MKAPSLRRTLLIRCGLGVGMLLCLLSAGVYLIVRQSLYRELDDSIEQTAALLANQVEWENDRITYEWQEGLGTNEALVSDDLFQFWDVHGGDTTRSPGLRSGDLPRFTGSDGQPLMRGILLPDGHRGRAVGMRIHPFVLPDELEAMRQRGTLIDPKTRPQILVVARDAEAIHHTLERLRWVLACGSLGTLGIGFLLIRRAVKITLLPMDELTSQMQDRAGPQLDSALEIPDNLPIELTGLARNFDSLLARVAAIRQREKDFIRHAAHELRTPIAGLRATTDLALSQSRDAASYAGHLAICQKTAIELGELVKRLSALARVGQTISPPSPVAIDLTELVRNTIASFTPRFAARGLQLQPLLPGEPLRVKADAALLRIILSNLLDNAASHASEGSAIVLSGNLTGTGVELRIANQADDLPDNLERLFEPLFRKESSRNGSASHLGIGLTLSLEAAGAMGAGLKALQPEAGWIALVLTLPAAD